MAKLIFQFFQIIMSAYHLRREAIKRIHYVSGLTLSIFIAVHLFNHFFAIAGAEAHIRMMEILRKVYRHPVIETFLLLVVGFQVITGIRLAYKRRATSTAEKIQVWSGLYLAFFLIAHVGAVISGRYVELLNTNFYYGAIGMNFDPAYFIFVPYYFLAVVAISLHVAAIHYIKTGARKISVTIGAVGVAAAVVIILAYTNNFQGKQMPKEYVDFMKAFFAKS